MSELARVCVINLTPCDAECWVCGGWIADLEFGIPIYEDRVLPNSWQGDWGGVPACERCFEAQQKLQASVTARGLLRIIARQDPAA